MTMLGVGVGGAFGQAAQGNTTIGQHAAQNVNTSIFDPQQYYAQQMRGMERNMGEHNFQIRTIDNGFILAFAIGINSYSKEIYCKDVTEISEQVIRVLVEMKLEK